MALGAPQARVERQRQKDTPPQWEYQFVESPHHQQQARESPRSCPPPPLRHTPSHATTSYACHLSPRPRHKDYKSGGWQTRGAHLFQLLHLLVNGPLPRHTTREQLGNHPLAVSNLEYRHNLDHGDKLDDRQLAIHLCCHKVHAIIRSAASTFHHSVACGRKQTLYSHVHEHRQLGGNKPVAISSQCHV